MRKLDSDRPGLYIVNSKREFVRNRILKQRDVSECLDFAYGMTFGGSGAHRDHRSGGQAHRHLGEIFINTFQGKLAEFVDRCILAVANSIGFSFLVGGVASLFVIVFVVFFRRSRTESKDAEVES